VRFTTGAVDVDNVGVNNSVFKANQGCIYNWNKTTLIDSALTAEAAKDAFVNGDSPFWITGRLECETLISDRSVIVLSQSDSGSRDGV